MTRHPPSLLRSFGGTGPPSPLRRFPPPLLRSFGEAVGATGLSEGGNITRLMAQRNAVSVLPLPVGARISVDSPRAIAGQPNRCGVVGAAKARLNQSRTAG